MSSDVFLDLKNRIALVTGGSRGIGAATVRMFTRAGGRVVFNYQRAREQAQAVMSECGGAQRCHGVAADLSGLGGAKELVDAAVAHFGGLDILVVNHGIWPAQDIPVNEMPDEHWSRTMAINLDSTFALVKHAVGQMKKQGRGGHVVVVSSTAGQRGEAFHCDYAASKGAVISMVKGLSTELAPDRIYVNCVAPGWVSTDMAAPALQDPQRSKEALGKIPLARPGKPEEIAAPILFLCTEHAGFITGEIFNVNGGAVLVG